MPSKSQAQRALIFAKFGPEFAKRHHFDNPGKLPERLHPKADADDKKAFVEAFATACVQAGLTPAGIAKRASAMAATLGTTKKADPTGLGEIAGAGAGLAGNVLGGLKDLGVNGFLLGSVGLPAAAGTLGGLAVGHAHNQADSSDLEAQHRLALARVYRRRADELGARRQADQMAAAHPDKYVVLG